MFRLITFGILAGTVICGDLIKCYNCGPDFGDCMSGWCMGAACQKITGNDGRIYKGCIDSAGIGNRYMQCYNDPDQRSCYCNNGDYCNGGSHIHSTVAGFICLALLMVLQLFT